VGDSDRKSVIVSIDRNGRVDIDIPAISGFDGFDKLRRYLQNEHGAVIKDCIEAPDACRCVFTLKGVDFILDYDDPYGNSIQSVGPDINHQVESIGRDLERRLKDL